MKPWPLSEFRNWDVNFGRKIYPCVAALRTFDAATSETDWIVIASHKLSDFLINWNTRSLQELGKSMTSSGPNPTRGGRGELRLNKRQYVSAFAGLLLAVPIWAAHTNSVAWNVSQPATIGGTQINPGDYVIRAEDGGSQLEVLSRGKVVAQVPCQWTQLPQKAEASEVDVDSGQVTQVKFGGRTAAISFSK